MTEEGGVLLAPPMPRQPPLGQLLALGGSLGCLEVCLDEEKPLHAVIPCSTAERVCPRDNQLPW